MNIEKISREDLFKLEKDYIFHGSKSCFEMAKPHKAKCDSKNPENEQTAVYGASDLRFAILFCFEKMPRAHFSWSATTKDGLSVGELKDGTYIEEDAKGYLYCFDKSKFKPTAEGSVQYLCLEPIQPKKVCEIEYKDYKDLFVQVSTKEVSL